MPNFDAKAFDLSEEKLDSIFDTGIKPWVFGDSTTSSDRVLLLVGAQPGAGKTRGGDAAAQESGQPITRIIGDKFRQFHPRYHELLQMHPAAMPDGTAQALRGWVERAIAFARKNRYSVLVEGAFRNPEIPLHTAELFSDRDYRVEAHLIAVSPELSHVSIGKRFVDAERARKEARFTTLEAHAAAYSALPATIQTLSRAGSPVDSLVVRSRDELLFTGIRTPGRSIRGALKAAEDEWDRKLSDDELAEWKRKSADVIAYFADRHPNDNDALASVTQLKFDIRYLTATAGGQVAVRGHVRGSGNVEPHTRSWPNR